MQRLRGSDAQTIYLETPSSPFVTLKAMIYQPTTAGEMPCYAEIKQFIACGITSWVKQGLGLRVIRVPFDLHHPLWVKDEHFTIDNHLHRIALPAPGTKQQFCDFISYIMSMPLDPNRPLWDSWIVEGLEGGKIAWVCKMHHVLADGLMSSDHLMTIHQQQAAEQQAEVTPVTSLKAYRKIPSSGFMVWAALTDLFKSYAFEFPGVYRQYRADKKSNNTLSEAAPAVAAAAFTAPHVFFNKPGGPYRAYRYETFSLAEFKALSKCLDCTINDLVMTLCSEALRRTIAEHEALPEKPLVIAMPVANRGADTQEKFLNSEIQNNNVAVAFVALDLSIENIYERLASIKASARAAMQQLRRTKGERMESFVDFMPGSVFRLMNWVFSKRQNRKKSPMANLAISNVPGPKQPLYACNGKLKMEELLSCGNLIDASAIGITVWSYVDNLAFSIFFRKGVMQHPEHFTRHLQDSFQQLLSEQNNGKQPGSNQS
jgi:WS/DGAT/MGAT family acyltransferase